MTRAADVGSSISLIVNADDLGMSRGVNRGIAEAFEHGIVTSASLMVDRPAAVDAAEYVRAHPKLDVGLHVELDVWRVGRLPRRGATRSETGLERRVSDQLDRQLTAFADLVGRPPSHVDSHQHRHTWPVVQPLFERRVRELGVPLRRTGLGARFSGEFYGHDGRGRPDPGAIATDALVQLLERLPPGVTELCCHPGYADGLDTWYRNEREQEVRTLCDPQVRVAIERLGIRLATFADVGMP